LFFVIVDCTAGLLRLCSDETVTFVKREISISSKLLLFLLEISKTVHTHGDTISFTTDSVTIVRICAGRAITISISGALNVLVKEVLGTNRSMRTRVSCSVGVKHARSKSSILATGIFLVTLARVACHATEARCARRGASTIIGSKNFASGVLEFFRFFHKLSLESGLAAVLS
jgi:hypothetical protein